jgi:hypothetical protein
MNYTAVKCFFPGDFSPPTKYDLMLVQWLGKKAYEVSEVVIVIGKAKEGEVTPDQKKDIWLDYLSSNQQSNIVVHKDDKSSPLSAIYKMQERSPEDAFSIAVPESVAKNETFQQHFEVFPNYQIIITPVFNKDASMEMNNAIASNDFEAFAKNLPGSIPLSKKQEIFKSLKPQDPVSEILDQQYWNKSLKELYNQYGI